ncbi:MAG: HNH endonuclease [Dehalococcoidia bacterium]
MDAATRTQVRRRAGNCCEYCGLAQEAVPVVTFHIEHIIPRQHGGGDDPSNLALACYHCNHHKGPNLTGIDPETGEIIPLFNPRTQRWDEHFALEGREVVGLTPTGRTTVRVLTMNSDVQQELRAELG